MGASVMGGPSAIIGASDIIYIIIILAEMGGTKYIQKKKVIKDEEAEKILRGEQRKLLLETSFTIAKILLTITIIIYLVIYKATDWSLTKAVTELKDGWLNEF